VKRFYQQEDEVLDYIVDLSDAMDPGDTISADPGAVVVTVGEGITLGGVSNSNTTVSVWLSGGVEGSVYSIRVVVETSQGRTFAEEFELKIT
jgi:hypothetical protein